MSNELMQYARGEVRPRRQDRMAARRAQAIRQEVQEAEMMATGGMVLAARIMEGGKDLHEYRRQLAGEDPILDAALMPFQNAAFSHAQRIQAHLFDPWGL